MRAWLPADAERLTGPAFALLRPAFARARAEAAPRRGDGPVRRLFVSFGLSDPGGVAIRVYDALRDRLGGVVTDLVLGPDAESLAPLRARAATDPGLSLHVNISDMAPLMARADLAIGAGGGTTWERAVLGLPTLAVIVAENQRPLIARLTADGMLLSVSLDQSDFVAALTGAYDRLQDPDLRRTLAERSAGLCDGQGAQRAADALLARLGQPTIRAGA